MPHSDSPTPADLVGKLDWLNVSCEKCGRSGRYSVRKLVEQLGADAKITDWRARITADCPKKTSIDMTDQYGARCPDLSRVRRPQGAEGPTKNGFAERVGASRRLTAQQRLGANRV